MYSTRKSARRVTMDTTSLDVRISCETFDVFPPLKFIFDTQNGAYNLDHDDVYDTSPPRNEASRGRRRGHSVLHAVKEPPRSVRLRRNSSGHEGSNPSYLELDSDDDSYDIDQLNSARDIKISSRLSSEVPMTLKEVSSQAKKLESSELTNGGRLTRSSRGRADCDEYESNQKRTRGDQKVATAPADKRQRVTEATSKRLVQQEAINEEDEEDQEEEDEDEDEEEEENGGRKYSLRDRDSSRRETMNISVLGGDGGGCARGRNQGATRSLRSGEHMISAPQPRLNLGFKNPHYSQGRYRRSGSRSGKHDHHHHKSHSDGARRHYDSSSDSSCDNRNSNRRDVRNGGRHGDQSGGGSEDAQFNTYEMERLQAERDSVQPLTMGSLGAGGGDMGMGGSLRDKASQRDMLRADAAPVAVDPKLGFQSIGGLEKHVQALKEMVVLPLLYPDVFQRFDTQPPRGVLFVGPPGTGKTLTARALANSVTINAAQGGRKVSFFMRKGADCLSKWVGEGERQLRLLFEQAKRYQPSIIFFDEIDGLAPVR